MIVYFSCKISNAILSELDRSGDDTSVLYEMSPIPMEFMRDSSYWITAPDMEYFLEGVVSSFNKKLEFIDRAGHEGSQLLAWGVLDSVLRMMPRPQEVFLQPEQFLSYFISPKPPVENFRKHAGGVSFDLPLPAEQYPHVTRYLKSAFEGLPTYVGEALAHCEWQDIHLEIRWDQNQKTIFEKQDVGHQMSPELFQQLMEDLQKTQSEREGLLKHISDLEIKVRDLEKNLEKIQPNSDSPARDNSAGVPMKELEAMASRVQDVIHSNPYYVLGHNLARLHDYMVRAQQLVTVLSQTKKGAGSTPQPSTAGSVAIRDAMKKIDWAFVKHQYPQIIRESFEIVRSIQVQNQRNSSNDIKQKERGENHVTNHASPF